jgi:hypothetical protein
MKLRVGDDRYEKSKFIAIENVDICIFGRQIEVNCVG